MLVYLTRRCRYISNKKRNPRRAGRESSVALDGIEGPSLGTEAEADGFQEVPELVGLPLGVVDPGDSPVVHSHEVVGRVAGDPPGVGTTGEDLCTRGGSGGHMCGSRNTKENPRVQRGYGCR